MPTTDYSVVITTCASAEDAQKIIDPLLEERLAACVQVMPIQSYYTWKGKVNNDAEHLLLIKCKASLFPAIQSSIRSHHSYETPEIIQVPIHDGFPAYLRWIDDVSQ